MEAIDLPQGSSGDNSLKRKIDVDLSNDTDSDDESSVELNPPPPEKNLDPQEFLLKAVIFFTFGLSCRIFIFYANYDVDTGLLIIPMPKVAEGLNINTDDFCIMWLGKIYTWYQDIVIDMDEMFERCWQAIGAFTIGIYERRFYDLATQEDAAGIAEYFNEIKFKRHFRYRAKKVTFNQFRGVSHLELAAFSANAAVFNALLDYGGYPPVTDFERVYANSNWFYPDHLQKAAFQAIFIIT